MERLLSPFVPRGYDLYVLGVQEGVSDRVYEAIASWTETFRVPLHTSFYSATVPHGVTPLRTTGPGGGNGSSAAYVSSSSVGGGDAGGAPTGPRVRIARKHGRAVAVQQLIDEARLGIAPDPCTNTVDMLDRVWGRGDGALLSPKFTGLAVFVAPVVAPYTRVLSVFKHSFGASEGSKGGVGVALGCYDVTLAFVNCHLASKKSDARRAQYCELVDRLGAKLGGRGALWGRGVGGGFGDFAAPLHMLLRCPRCKGLMLPPPASPTEPLRFHTHTCDPAPAPADTPCRVRAQRVVPPRCVDGRPQHARQGRLGRRGREHDHERALTGAAVRARRAAR